jgi:hypothetical protein
MFCQEILGIVATRLESILLRLHAFERADYIIEVVVTDQVANGFIGSEGKASTLAVIISEEAMTIY